MENGFTSIQKLFDGILGMYNAVFGFLPSWVGLFVGSAFVFAIVVFIYRLIRG